MLIIFYNFFIILFYIPYIFLILFRRFIKKEHEKKYKEKIFSSNFKRPEGFLFWFHVASIGEFKSILPVIDFYLKQNTKNNFLITTVTLSSFKELEKKYGSNNRVYHQFLPYDFKFLINDFFKNWRPNIVSFVDSEIWPNFILKIKEEKLPFILLNARITKKSFIRWNILGKLSNKIFESFSLCISSNKDTSDYLKILGAQNIKFFGNIKFCSVLENKTEESEQFKKISNKKIWCAVSTHAGEENFCGKVHNIIKKSEKKIVTIIIPRHIHRIEGIFSVLKDFGFNVQIKNENESIDNSADIVLVNYYGAVSKYLKYFKQIFVGKSMLKKFENTGGQNPIDAAKMGCHIYHGPYVYNFKEIYRYLDESKLSEEIKNPENLANKLIENFKLDLQSDSEKIKKLNIYSNKIFDNVINEYNKFIK
tara:strand:+ start:2017 stop:3282 length:1266 start_codon:yes stop_codon:yes gene_type:complete